MFCCWKRNKISAIHEPQMFKTCLVPPDAIMMLPDDDICCWICLEPASLKEDLKRVCKCNTVVHERCIVRWQTVKKGTMEERVCRFCKTSLLTVPSKQKVVNVFFKDSFLGDVTVNYSTEYFQESLARIMGKYEFDISRMSLEFICRQGIQQVCVRTGLFGFESVQMQDILFIRITISDIPEHSEAHT
jgi:hypothetical protein